LCQKELHYLVFRPLAIRNPNLSETDPELADLIEKKHARGEVVGFNVDVGGILMPIWRKHRESFFFMMLFP
jgi:hypothetical protein